MPVSLDVVFITLAFGLAGFVKGVIGLGLPTIAVGLLGIVMPPVAAASLLIIPNIVTNIWQLAAGPRFKPLVLRLWPMMAGIVAGTLTGAPLLEQQASGWTSLALGAALIAYAGFGLSGIKLTLTARDERVWSPVIGLTTGVMTMVTGVFVVPAVPYLQALDLNKEDLVQALGLSFLVSTLALAAVLVIFGMFPSSVAAGSLLAVMPALLGMAIGTKVRAAISPVLFRHCFFFGLILLGSYLVLRGVANQ